MSKAFKRIAFAGLAAILAVTISTLIHTEMLSKNPLRKTDDELKSWILQQTPVGSSVNQVKSFITRQGWKLKYDFSGNPNNLSRTFYPGVEGEHIIGADIGNYQGIPFRFYVDAYWGFDSSDKLIALKVRKLPDAL